MKMELFNHVIGLLFMYFLFFIKEKRCIRFLWPVLLSTFEIENGKTNNTHVFRKRKVNSFLLFSKYIQCERN